MTQPVPRRQRFGFTIVELLVVLALIAMLLALLLVSIGKVREAAALSQSTNNLRQIGLAFHQFHDVHRYLPYNGTEAPYSVSGRKRGGPAVALQDSTGSWAFMILPYVDQQALFATRDTSTGVAVFLCPGRGRPTHSTLASNPGAWTDYFINSFLNDPNGDPNARDSRRTLAGIADGTSQTIIVGHGQMNPKDYLATAPVLDFTQTIFTGGSPALCRSKANVVNARDALHAQAGNWGGPFAQGSLMVMADGSTRTFSYSLAGGAIVDGEGDDGTFSGFLTPSGGESPDPVPHRDHDHDHDHHGGQRHRR
ncbi:MAG TPA: DUF1559 domain-containing protein [Gemmataceae bacterium]|nr:DUF1559 domain-containing protein [Gemmataceae bacterium]